MGQNEAQRLRAPNDLKKLSRARIGRFFANSCILQGKPAISDDSPQ
jgi:hypothetical protein